MVIEPQSTYIYGSISWPSAGKRGLGRLQRLRGLAGHPAPPDEFAIQILREFSATELVGKLYVKSSIGSWMPVAPATLPTYDWYKFFSAAKRHLKFNVSGAGDWEILYLRNESDQTGPYVAVALKLLSRTLSHGLDAEITK